MRLGAAADLRFEQTVAEFLDYVTALGLDHVELKREYMHAPPEAPAADELGTLLDSYDATLTLHAPFRDWNFGSFNDASRRAAVSQVKDTLDDAHEAGAGAVVVHGGAVPRRYPERVQEKAVDNAVESLAACADYAADVGVPLCLENQPRSDEKRRHTTTPEDLAALLDRVGAAPEALRVTLDVGHAKVNGFTPREFTDRVGDRVEVLHLSDNDGTSDDHEPLPDYEGVLEMVGAPYNVFEMKTVDDIARCVGESPPAR
jgi:sugar phosphate isomerase/epimerase